MKLIISNYRKILTFYGIAFITTYILHHWLPNHEVEFYHSYLLHYAMDSLFILTLFITVWEANLRVNSRLDKYFIWETHPIKRVISQILINTVSSFIIILVLVSIYSFIIAQVNPSVISSVQTESAYPVIKNSMVTFIGLFIFYQVVYISVYFFMQWSKSLIESERLKRENVYSQLQALRVQVNPHFLFNSLSSLVSLIEEDKTLAIEFVQELSNVYRYLLVQQNENLVRVCDEMNFINSFIYLHKARYGENLSAGINIEKKYMDYYIPPQTLQILVENAIKHNIISADKPFVIKIYTDGDGSIVIENKLQRKTAPAHTGIGLKNIEGRYRLLGRRNIVVDETNGSFTVTVPLIKIKEANESIDN